ncbi:MAG: hypothetical protein ACM3SS_25065 [Rhodospirillaceae bacterium]
MSGTSPVRHIPLAGLVDYWFDEHGESPHEEHLLACADCSERLAWIAGLGEEIQDIVKRGEAMMVLTGGLLKQLAAAGLRIREYRLRPGASVNCTIAPSDDLVVAHLEAPLAGVDRLDVVSSVGGVLHRLDDIPFDPSSGEVLLAPRTGDLRGLGHATEVARLVAVGAEGEQVIAEYTFNHSPFRD